MTSGWLHFFNESYKYLKKRIRTVNEYKINIINLGVILFENIHKC